MKKLFQNARADIFWEIELDEDERILITTGPRGAAGETTIIEDAFGERQMPADVLFDTLIDELDGDFEEVMPDDLLEQVERGHDVELRGRLRAFYANHEYKEHQGKLCGALDCRVDFTANAALGVFYEEFWDGEKAVQLIPISSKLVGEDHDEEDEQAWIGVDPSLADGPVYELFTSSTYEKAYDSLDAFLADLED